MKKFAIELEDSVVDKIVSIYGYVAEDILKQIIEDSVTPCYVLTCTRIGIDFESTFFDKKLAEKVFATNLITYLSDHNWCSTDKPIEKIIECGVFEGINFRMELKEK